MTYDRRWLEQTTRKTAQLWRGVEAQHVIATLRLVDSVREQELLEQLLEETKPPLADAWHGAHYLISSPFRYRSPYATRFRGPHDPGVWYGATTRETALGELAYWRWKFLDDTVAAIPAVLVELTLFRATIDGRCADLVRPPWSTVAGEWESDDYAACQALAAAARDAGVDWIRYASVRAEGSRGTATCGAALHPLCLRFIGGSEETWRAKVVRDRVLMIHEQDALEFDPASWVR